MAITINGSSVAAKPGSILHEYLSEKLDNGMLIVPQTTLSIKPFDEVVITSDTLTKYMYISDIKRQTSRFDATKEYNYTLGLTSSTIQLQRIVLPNKSITQPLTGTLTTIYDKLSEYVSMYASHLTLSNDIRVLTENVTAPELQWQRPTLFEVFNDLLAEVDCVVTMTDFDTISYLDLNIDGNEISDTDLADVELEQNIMEYANKIEVELENAVVNQSNTRCIEWVALKTDGEAILTTSNAKFILEKPIDKINQVILKWDNDPSSFTGPEVDITAKVVDKSVYDLAKSSNSTGLVSGNYKRDRLYYTKGSNIIDGVCYTEETWLGIITYKTIINIFNNLYYGIKADNTDILEFLIKIDYQALETTKSISNKSTAYITLTTQTGNTLINNQESSYVDYRAFNNKQQFNAYRMAEPLLRAKAKYDSYSNIPKLGDYYDTDYKLSEREYALYDDFVNFQGVLQRNYVLKDLFTNIKTERRYTSLAAKNEALESHHITEYYFNLAKNFDYEISLNSNTLNSTFENYMLRFAQANENIKLIHFKTNESVDIGVTPSTYYTKNSVALTYKMADNFSAGVQVDDDNNINYVSYVDDDGKFTSFVYKLYKGYDLTAMMLGGVYPKTKLKLLPEIDTTYLNSDDLVYTSGTIYRYKDNREITAETLQFNFTHDSDTVYGLYFFKNNPLTYAGGGETLSVAYSQLENYNNGDQKIKGLIADSSKLTYTILGNAITVTSPDSSIDISELASWAICDSRGNLYIGVNVNYLASTNTIDVTIPLEMSVLATLIQEQFYSVDTSISLDMTVTPTVYKRDFHLLQEAISLGITVEPSLYIVVFKEANAVVDMSLNVDATVEQLIVKNVNAIVDIPLDINVNVFEVITRNVNAVVNIPVGVETDVSARHIFGVAEEISLAPEVVYTVLTGTNGSAFKTTDASGSLPYDYGGWVDAGGLSYYAGTLFDPDNYSIGDILQVWTDYQRGLWRVKEQAYNSSVTVGAGSETDMDDILSAVQSQVPQLYNDWQAGWGGILRVDNGTTYTYYKIVGEFVYVEIVFLEN
jgi:hypothetical protein